MNRAFLDLPGELTIHLSDDRFDRNLVVVLVEHDLGPKYGGRRAGWVALSRNFLLDVAGADLLPLLEPLLERALAPWRFPDRPAFPELELFPLLEAGRRWIAGLPQWWRTLPGELRATVRDLRP